MLSRILRSHISVQSFRTTSRIATATGSQPQHPTHTPDTYSKEVDSTPPPDPTIHRVDAASEAVQKPHEPPSGEYSQAGTKTHDYENAGKDPKNA